MFSFRSQSMDSYIWYKIVHQNEYQLLDDLSGKVVVDIGAHIGSFSIASLHRKASYIYAYEAHPENYELAKSNLQKTEAQNYCVENLAVCGANDSEEVGYNQLGFNTGQHHIDLNGQGIKTINLDDIVTRVTSEQEKRIDILKIDAEGSEYPILYTASSLFSIKNIIGEYHNNVPQIKIDQNNHYGHNGKDFIKFLRDVGFMVYHKYIHEAGVFFATREIGKQPFLIDVELFE